MERSNKYSGLSALLVAMAIAIGAFGAHVINPGLEEKYIRTMGTANLYFLFHALALIIISSNTEFQSQRRLRMVFTLVLIGIILFSGSLYWIVLCHYCDFVLPSFVGPLTPIGGLCFIAAWLLLAFHYFVL